MSSSEEGTPKIASVFNFLGNHRRVLLVEYLSLFNTGATVEVRHLARIIRAVEIGVPPRDIHTADYESAYNSLIQKHLPKFEAMQIVEYDDQRKTVTVRSDLQRYVILASLAQYLTGNHQSSSV